MTAPSNPYAPPSAGLTEPGAALAPFAFAAAVIATPQLFALIVLGWLSVNALIEFHVATLDPNDIGGAIRATLLPNALLHPLFVGITLEACRRFQAGEAMALGGLGAAGLRLWPRIFVVAFVANLLTLLGFIALVIPGLWLALRYSFVEVVAVAEGTGHTAARARSALFARGRYWALVRVHLLILVPFAALALVGAAGALWFPALEHPLVNAALDTLTDIVDLARFAVFWAIYQAARAAEPVEA